MTLNWLFFVHTYRGVILFLSYTLYFNEGGTNMKPKRKSFFAKSAKLSMGAVLAVLIFLSYSSYCIAASQASSDTPEYANCPCKQTSSDMLNSGVSNATGDYWQALAKCQNITDPGGQNDCNLQANDDFNASIDELNAQFKARQNVCKILGCAAYDPIINPSDFVVIINNPYFPLIPGTTFIYEGKKGGANEHVEVAVTYDSEIIMGVICVVIRDKAFLDGELVEDTMDWYAQDKDGNVWYFGELSYGYEGGNIVSLEGSWKAGVDGAKPGIIMKGTPKVGNLYRQEFALGVAEDMSQVLGLNATTKAGNVTYKNCLKTKDFSPLEPGIIENKFFKPGVGQVNTINLTNGDYEQLINITHQ